MGTQSGANDDSARYYGEFSLSISEAMKRQLMSALEALKPVLLNSHNLLAIQDRPGIYQLFLDGESVYIGKADSDLSGRLDQHRRKLFGRREELEEGQTPNPVLPAERMSFKCLYVNEDIDSLGPEKMLISQFRVRGEAPWNNKGFGNNDPGKERDTSAVKKVHFDKSFPINLELPVTPVPRMLARGEQPLDNLHSAMTAIKLAMPFNFRFSSTADDSRTLKSTAVDRYQVERVTRSVREWMEWIADRLPKGWSVIALPGYIISYNHSRADVDKHLSRMSVWWAEGGHHAYEEHEATYASGEVKEDD